MKITPIHVWVNSCEETLLGEDGAAELTYEDIVQLAGKNPNVLYTITYDNRRPLGGGCVVPGNTITVYEGASIVCCHTGQA